MKLLILIAAILAWSLGSGNVALGGEIVTLCLAAVTALQIVILAAVGTIIAKNQ